MKGLFKKSLIMGALVLTSSVSQTFADDCTPSVTYLATQVPDTVDFPGNFVVHDFYGSSVEINGDYYFVTAPGAHPAAEPQKTAAGIVYVYHKENDSWILKQTITTDGTSDHVGGASVKSQDDWLFVSAFGTPIGDSGTVFDQNFKGSVRIYQLNNNSNDPNQGLWQLVQVLDSSTVSQLADLSSRVFTNPADPTQSDPSGALFGSSVSIDVKKGWIIVGAQGQNGVDANNNVIKEAGAAYFFKLNSSTNQWEYAQKFTNPTGLFVKDNFGSVVEINGKWAMVSNGDLQNHPGGRLINSNVWVYHLHNNQWQYEQQLSGSQPQSLSNTLGFFDAFGNSISISHEWAVIGAPLDSTNGRAMGAAYVFKRDGNQWSLKQTIYSDEPFDPAVPGHMLGFLNAVKVSNNILAVGDPGHSGPAGQIHQGAILTYECDDDVWVKQVTVFDPQGTDHDFFGVGVAINDKLILGGTLTAVDFGYPAFVPPVGRTFIQIAPGVNIPLVANGKAVLFQANCFEEE